ncbi:CaiB/BaiF CoA transferase family protein [Demequina maris]|uniref:CaiB/BaiF CoA transferase family protein n=1 Tax=Demequina maris TaxID=1638982 RepID=UPI0009E46005|nr:CaiB/BaiF CoA-transferase family protein [Demequina maris]
MTRPLEGILVLDFTQFMSGPSATLRLADLGARVIKVEHRERGDLSRTAYAPAFDLGDAPAFFQAINRGKESVAADLRDPRDVALLLEIAAEADVVVANFRPGVMDRHGLGYERLRASNPALVYGEITGYGAEGPWALEPGQDLLLQAASGMMWLTGADDDGPVPIGIAMADYCAGAMLAQGVLAALAGGGGTRVDVSMLEAVLDLQFEPFTLYLQDSEEPKRGGVNPAHPLVAAPYGVYRTSDGYLALAMTPIDTLAALVGCEELSQFTDRGRWFHERDEIKGVLAAHLASESTRHWLDRLEPADVWCAEVLSWADLVMHEGFLALDMVQEVGEGADSYRVTRCPIRIDGQVLRSPARAPRLGEHTESIRAEFGR